MQNCIILGSGRSGTSLAAGILSPAGYFMGDDLHAADEGNPKGYFESWQVNSINEEILATTIPCRPRWLLGRIFPSWRPPYRQRWLAGLEKGISFECSRAVKNRIEEIVSSEPYCLKDPRFCYTLSLWRSFLKKIVFICVFRHPGATAHSIIKECRRVRDYKMYISDTVSACHLWNSMYTYVLDVHYPLGGKWLFIHYDQLLDGSAIERMEKALDINVDRKFADMRLNRSLPNEKIPENSLILYRKLCELAKYDKDI